MSLDGAVPAAEVLPAARELLVQGFQLNLCNADLRLFSPEGFRHMVEDSAWLTRGCAIFFLVASLLQFALMIFAMRLDKKRNPVLVKINRIREVSSKDYYEDEGNDPMEGLPAYEDFKKQQSHKGFRNKMKDLTSRKMGDMKEMHVEDVTDKSWQWLVRIFARHALRYAFKWKMASLEPGAFQYITQDEFRADASAAVTDFVLQPHEQHIFIFLMTSSRFTSAFLANYKLSRLERFTSFAVVLLSSVAMIVVVFHWLGYFGGHSAGAAGADVHSECQNSGRGSTVQFFEELLVSFAIYFFNELLLAVAVRIRGGRFLLSKAIVYDEWSWSPICRLGVYVIFMFLLYLCSMFVVLHFLATATEDDVDHCFLFMGIVFGFAVIVKPLMICSSLMAFWMASQSWKAGAVTQEMVSMLYIADKRPNTLSAKEIEKLDEDFAKNLLGLHDAGPVFFEDHHEPLQEDPQIQVDVSRLSSTASWDEGPGRGSERGGKASMIDRLIAADLQEATRSRAQKRRAQTLHGVQEQAHYAEAPGEFGRPARARSFAAQEDNPQFPEDGADEEAVEMEIDAFDSESWDELNSEDGPLPIGP